MAPLKILLDSRNTPGIAAVKIWIREGSRADPYGQKGVHQLLGSILTRGCGPYSNLEVADIIEGCGASMRCDTYEDGFLLSLKCSAEDQSTLLPIIGWMITAPHLEPNQINLERELCLQILNRQKESPFCQAFNSWRKLVYDKTPYGHDPLGRQDDVRKITRTNLVNLSKEFIRREKVLVVSGSFSETILQEIQELEPFARLTSIETGKESLSKTKLDFRAKPSKQSVILQNQETSQVVIMLGQKTISHSHPDDIALRLLACHLGVGMSSLLFKRLREDNALAYDVGVYHPIREYKSPFVIHASTSKEKALLSLKLLLKSWEEILKEPLSDQEIALARAKFKGNLAHNSQTISQRAERKAQLIGFNMSESHDAESLEEIKYISSQALVESARRHLQNPLLSLCGPEMTIKELAGYWNDHYESFRSV